MAQQVTGWPIRKVLATGLSGIATVVVVWAARRWLGLELAPEDAAALVAVVGAVVGVLVPPHVRDQVVATDEELKKLADEAAGGG